MGQQQLLLVILVTIIVGIATVVAINVFGTSAQSANEDAVRQDVLTIASASQGWYIKPEMMGGGGNSFAGITFNDFNFAAAALADQGKTAVNMNGTYVLGAGDASSVAITAYPASADDYGGDETTADKTSSNQMDATICKGDIIWEANATCDDSTS